MADATRLHRLPLRDLLNQLDHRCREMSEHLQMDIVPTIAEFHRMTRPARKKSSFPSIRSLYNLHERLRKSNEYADKVADSIDECLRVVEERLARQ